MINQKELGKTYDHLRGKIVLVYFGRVPSKYKRIEYQIALTQKENYFGTFRAILAQIVRTHFNGQVLEIETKYLGDYYGLKIRKEEIDKLTIAEKTN